MEIGSEASILCPSHDTSIKHKKGWTIYEIQNSRNGGWWRMSSITEFWCQMTANPLLFVAVTLTLGVILVNGWTDAPNAIATCVVTRCMPAKAAILMAAVFNFLGVFVMTKINNEVAVTITSMVNFGDNAGRTVIIVLCAAMLAIVIWATLAWVFGIPTSESHALIAGLSGSAIALNNSLEIGRASCRERV